MAMKVFGMLVVLLVVFVIATWGLRALKEQVEVEEKRLMLLLMEVLLPMVMEAATADLMTLTREILVALLSQGLPFGVSVRLQPARTMKCWISVDVKTGLSVP